jgi:hypothetical protein
MAANNNKDVSTASNIKKRFIFNRIPSVKFMDIPPPIVHVYSPVDIQELPNWAHIASERQRDFYMKRCHCANILDIFILKHVSNCK